MADINIFDLSGKISARFKFPVYDEGTVTGSKNITENLGYVVGGTSDTAKIIINSVANLYETYTIDATNTKVTYEKALSVYMDEIEEETGSILTPDDVKWLLTVKSTSQLGDKAENNWGYLKGSLTPEKAEMLDSVFRLLWGGSTNTFNDLDLTAIFKPYEGDENNG